MTNINIRTDSEVKAKAQDIFSSLGLDMTTAINLFLRQTIRQNDLPFTLTTKTKADRTQRDAMFGYLRGKYSMSDDFDSPLEDFKEYME